MPYKTSGTFSGAFTYQDIGLVSVSPNHGPSGGGNTITLTGSYFGPGMRAIFGANTASSVVVDSPTGARVTVPAHSPGVVDIEAKFLNLIPNDPKFTGTLTSSFIPNVWIAAGGGLAGYTGTFGVASYSHSFMSGTCCRISASSSAVGGNSWLYPLLGYYFPMSQLTSTNGIVTFDWCPLTGTFATSGSSNVTFLMQLEATTSPTGGNGPWIGDWGRKVWILGGYYEGIGTSGSRDGTFFTSPINPGQVRTVSFNARDALFSTFPTGTMLSGVQYAFIQLMMNAGTYNSTGPAEFSLLIGNFR